jgi:hypothetical protein
MTHVATHARHAQRGATLLVSLIMLVMLTMFAVAGFNLSSINLKIASNFQQQRNVEMAVQQALEQVLSTVATFIPTPALQTITVSGIPVTVAAAVCYHRADAPGYEQNFDSKVPEDDVWELVATATDPYGGAKAAITAGVTMRMLQGGCT